MREHSPAMTRGRATANPAVSPDCPPPFEPGIPITEARDGPPATGRLVDFYLAPSGEGGGGA